VSTDKQTGAAIAAALLGANVEPADQADEPEAEAGDDGVSATGNPPDDEPTEADQIAGLFARKARKQRAGLEALGLVDPEPDELDQGEDDREPDFDAGAREPYSPAPDPAREHDLAVVDALATRQANRGLSGWRL
jgi:hypothetical protein